MIIDALYSVARQRPDHAALIYNDGVVSYRDLFRMVEGLRQHLAPLALPEGGVAVLCIDGLADGWVATLALRALGLTTISVPALARVAELNLPNIVCVVTSAQEPHHDGLADTYPRVRLQMDVLRAALASPELDEMPAPGKASAHIFLTSGTTGRPKKLLVNGAVMMQRCQSRTVSFGLDVNTVMFLGAYGPWSGPGQTYPLAVWLLGGTIVMGQGSDPYGAFQHPAITHVHVGAAMLADLVAAIPSGQPRRPHIFIMSGTSALPNVVARAVHERITSNLFEFVSSTEVSPFLSVQVLATAQPRRYQIVAGREVRIVAPDGTPAGVDQVGEIWVRLVDAVSGYLDDPETSQRFFRDGCFITGDLASMDACGLITLHGRATEILSLAVGKLAVVPLEHGIRDRLQVTQVCLVQSAGIVTDLHLFIEAPAGLPTQAIGEAVAEFLGGLGPVSVHVVAAVPRKSYGKLDRAATLAMIPLG